MPYSSRPDDDDARQIEEALAYQAELARRAPDPQPMPPDTAAALALQSVIDVAQQTLSLIRRQSELAAELEDQRDRISQVEQNAAHSREWIALAGFVNRYRVSHVDTDVESMSRLGRLIRKWHVDNGLHFKQKGAYDQRFGSVNGWQVRHLYSYFKGSGYTLDEDQYRADQRYRQS